MPLLKEGVFSVLSLLAAISIRILKAITKVIENPKEPAHFRLLNLSPHIDGGLSRSFPICVSMRRGEPTTGAV